MYIASCSQKNLSEHVSSMLLSTANNFEELCVEDRKYCDLCLFNTIYTCAKYLQSCLSQSAFTCSKLKKRSTRTRCETFSKLTIKTPERCLESFWCLYC